MSQPKMIDNRIARPYTIQAASYIDTADKNIYPGN
jgi:hypothetical protein